MTRRTWRHLLAALPFVGLIAAVAALAWMVDLRAAGRALVGAHPGWVALAAGLVLLAPVLVAAKLWWILRVVGLPRRLRDCWSAVLAAVSLNAVLPGRGGDLVRAVFLADEPGSLSILAGAVLVERLVDLLALSLLAFAGATWAGSTGAMALAGAICLLSASALGVLAAGHRLPAALAERVGRSARALLTRPAGALGALGLGLVSWTNAAAVLGCCLLAAGADAPAVAVARAAPLAILAGIVPVSVSGIGTRDVALVALLHGQVEPEVVAAAALLYTVLMYWFLAAFGALALGRETLRRVRAAVARPA